MKFLRSMDISTDLGRLAWLGKLIYLYHIRLATDRIFSSDDGLSAGQTVGTAQ